MWEKEKRTVGFLDDFLRISSKKIQWIEMIFAESPKKFRAGHEGR
jgi:hypothetical protein